MQLEALISDAVAASGGSGAEDVKAESGFGDCLLSAQTTAATVAPVAGRTEEVEGPRPAETPEDDESGHDAKKIELGDALIAALLLMAGACAPEADPISSNVSLTPGLEAAPPATAPEEAAPVPRGPLSCAPAVEAPLTSAPPLPASAIMAAAANAPLASAPPPEPESEPAAPAAAPAPEKKTSASAATLRIPPQADNAAVTVKPAREEKPASAVKASGHRETQEALPVKASEADAAEASVSAAAMVVAPEREAVVGEDGKPATQRAVDGDAQSKPEVRVAVTTDGEKRKTQAEGGREAPAEGEGRAGQDAARGREAEGGARSHAGLAAQRPPHAASTVPALPPSAVRGAADRPIAATGAAGMERVMPLAQSLASGESPSTQRIALRLEPDSWGPVRMNLELSQGVVRVDLSTGAGSAGPQLWDKRGELSSAMDDKGFTLRSFSVNGGDGSSGGNGDGARRAPQTAAPGVWGGEAEESATPKEESPERASGLLSLWA